jgi:hypothetical protein
VKKNRPERSDNAGKKPWQPRRDAADKAPFEKKPYRGKNNSSSAENKTGSRKPSRPDTQTGGKPSTARGRKKP